VKTDPIRNGNFLELASSNRLILGIKNCSNHSKIKESQVGSKQSFEGHRGQALVRRERGFATERKEMQKGTKKQAFGRGRSAVGKRNDEEIIPLQKTL
jgi:hypothetical protein